MREVLYSVLGYVLAISILVVVHEFGHFWVAKRLGVRVLRFSVGFGRVLWSRKRGPDGTEYALSMLPFGGYVKMLDEREGEVDPAERHRAFNQQSIPVRAAVVVAGPTANFLFAILATWVVWMIGVPGLQPVVGAVVPGSPAAVAGFRVGDRLMSVDGGRVYSWDQPRLWLLQKAANHDKVTVVVTNPAGHERTRILDLSHVPAQLVSEAAIGRMTGLVGPLPVLKPVIGQVIAGGPAAQAGLEPGDRILQVGGVHPKTWDALVAVIAGHAGRPLPFVIGRNGKVLHVVITPKAVTENGQTNGRIEAVVQLPPLPRSLETTVRLAPWGALKASLRTTWDVSALSVEMLYRMARLQISPKSISGPITIARYAGYTVQIGLGSFLSFLAFVSISLGVLNLLPVPVLDGGHLLFYGIEAVKGSPVSTTVQSWGQRVGLTLLLGLVLLAFYNDFAKILH